MEQLIVFQLRASVVPFQLLRPLPTVFTCVRGICEDSHLIEMPAKVRKEFESHIDCLSKGIQAVSDMAKLPAKDSNEVLNKSKQLQEAKGDTLCEKTCELNLALERLCEKNKTPIREECRAHPFVFRDIYRSTVDVKKISLIFQDEVMDRVSHLKEILAERCYYDVDMRSEKSFKLQTADSDLLLFAPTENPSPLYLNGIPKSRIPTLLMVDFGGNFEEVSIGNLRSAFMHERYGINVLYYPFSPIRLFQKIDTRYIQHIYQKESKNAPLL
jgi:hypothetical protein